MTFFRRFLKRDRAAAVVEFALVVPLFVVLVTGIIMFSRAYTRLNALNAALRDGARMAAADQFPDSLTRQAVIKGRIVQFSSAFGFPIDTSQVTITYTPGGPNVTVGVTNYPLFAGMNFLGGLQNIQVTRSVVFRHEWAP
jgi:Flp pilus assembly protein TadG